MKQISVLTLGSRGDIQPFISLCLSLERAGFYVKLITYSKFEALVRSYGINFHSIKHSYEEIFVKAIRSPGNPFTATRRIRDKIGNTLDKVLTDCWLACQGTDAIVNSGTAFWGFDIAERLRIPSISVGLIPLRPTEEFPHCITPRINLNGTLNKLSGALVSRALWSIYRDSINLWREETLGLKAWKSVPFESQKWSNQLELLAYSPTIVPQPGDWSGDIYTTGFWFLDEPEEFAPDPELLRFLSEGPPPIYVGFGSMSVAKAERVRLMNLFSNALKRTNQRGIFSGDLSREVNLCDHIFCADSVPHSWLLPLTSLVIHHGGAGTTGASLRAGRPSIVIPFYSDQPFWADRLFQLKVSPELFQKNTITEEAICEAIQEINDNPSFASRAENLGRSVRNERGVTQAVSLISNHIERHYQTGL